MELVKHMPVTRKYGCPLCSHEFLFLHLKREEPPPDYCPKCGEYMGSELPEIPTAAAIGTIKGKIVDKTYNQLVEAGNIRAELTGDPSHKITNLRDGNREGDIAAMPYEPSQKYKDAVKEIEQVAGPNMNWGVAPGGVSVQDTVALAKAGAHEGTGASVLSAIQGAQQLFTKLPGDFKPSWGGG